VRLNESVGVITTAPGWLSAFVRATWLGILLLLMHGCLASVSHICSCPGFGVHSGKTFTEQLRSLRTNNMYITK
jgi:hypothetical protein